MPNMDLKKIPMPEQKPEERVQNFNEVPFGYTEEQAIIEADRCLQCKHRPCVAGCPVNVPIPEFIAALKDKDFSKSIEIMLSENRLPAVCGRVCPQESQCEALCVRGIKGEPVGVGRLERFIADYAMEHALIKTEKAPSNGKKVAVVGGGPAGLTCAGELALLGYEVTLFEALHALGGVLMYGIPEFRLPKSIVQKEIDNVVKLGVTIQKNVIVGRSITIDELFTDGFQAVFVGSGAGLPTFLRIPGENLNGVYSANEFLTRSNLMKAYDPSSTTPVIVGKRVAVVGGGNVAMDAARTAKRLGAEEVYIVYRRSDEELPARREEIHHAKEEGIIFKLLNNPVSIHGSAEGWVTGMECLRMELGEPDDSGRRRPVAVEGSNFVIDLETVIVAIGQAPNPLIRQTTPGLETQSWGGIIVDEATMKTSKDAVYAGGDVVTGAATVILAMGAGKTAAQSIHKQLGA